MIDRAIENFSMLSRENIDSLRFCDCGYAAHCEPCKVSDAVLPYTPSVTAAFDELTGGEFDFYGLDNNSFKIDEMMFEAIEDEGDGYRSYLGCIALPRKADLIFFRSPIARIRIESSQNNPLATPTAFIGYYFVDTSDEHVWLQLGTDHSDDWYPSFVCTYTPRLDEIQEQK